MRFSRLTLKITLFLMLLIIFSMLVYSLVFINSERNRLRNEILNDGITFAEFATPVIYQNYLRYYRTYTPENFQAFKKTIADQLMRNDDISEISILSTSGRILFDSQEFVQGQYTNDEVRLVEDQELLSMLKTDQLATREINNGQNIVLEVLVPINEDSIGHIASIKYVVSFERLGQQLQAVYWNALLTIIPVMVITSIINIIFSYQIARPIVKLTALTKRVSSGDLDFNVNIKTNDEIGELANSFADMANQLRKSRDRLESYAKNLQGQVDERTKEIESQLDELKRMNEAMVGREMRMIELKNRLSKYESDFDPTPLNN